MSFITGFDRQQTALFPQAIDQLIDSNNPVRFIDVFVDNLKTVDYGFCSFRLKTGLVTQLI